MRIRSIDLAIADTRLAIKYLMEKGLHRNEALTLLKIAYLARISDCLEHIIDKDRYYRF